LEFKPVNFNAAAGTGYLGSEVGYIKQAGVTEYKFGQGYWEADTGDTYSFRYSFGNDDWYTGTVYLNPAYNAYYPGRSWTNKNESGQTGSYSITGLSHNGVAATAYGQVFVSITMMVMAANLLLLPQRRDCGGNRLPGERSRLYQAG